MTPPLDPQVRELIAKALETLSEVEGYTNYDEVNSRVDAALVALHELDALFTRPVPQPDGGLVQLIEKWRSWEHISRHAGSSTEAFVCAADDLEQWLAASRPDGEDGIALIAAERRRQVSAEGWTPAHDAEHALGELAQAGAAYAKVASALTRGASANEFDADMMMSEGEWPFEASWWKPSDDPIRTLVKAGALIAAEIDRLNGSRPVDGEARPQEGK